MTRRKFLCGLGGAAATWPLATRAQQPEGLRQVGILLPFAETDAESHVHLDIVSKRLEQLGWTEGGNFRIRVRYGAGNTDRMRGLAKQLVAWKPDVILTRSTPAT